MDNMPKEEEAVNIFKTVYKHPNVITPVLVNYAFNCPYIIEVSENNLHTLFGVTAVNVKTRKYVQ